MRKAATIAGVVALATTVFTTPALAQGSASGSCGQSAGAYGMTDVNSSKVNDAGDTVPALFYQVNYAGVSAPTTVGVIVRYDGDLQNQVAATSFTADNSGGSFEGALRANISPDAQGFANSIDAGWRGRSDNGPVAQMGNESGNKSTNGLRSGTGQSGTQGGLTPGNYVFYVYTGERRDVPNVKDGTVALNAFVADEKGFLGTFSCGVSTDEGSGPG